MKIYLWMLSAAVLIGALRVKTAFGTCTPLCTWNFCDFLLDPAKRNASKKGSTFKAHASLRFRKPWLLSVVSAGLLSLIAKGGNIFSH